MNASKEKTTTTTTIDWSQLRPTVLKLADADPDTDTLVTASAETYQSLDGLQWKNSKLVKIWNSSFTYECLVSSKTSYAEWVKRKEEARCACLAGVMPGVHFSKELQFMVALVRYWLRYQAATSNVLIIHRARGSDSVHSAQLLEAVLMDPLFGKLVDHDTRFYPGDDHETRMHPLEYTNHLSASPIDFALRMSLGNRMIVFRHGWKHHQIRAELPSELLPREAKVTFALIGTAAHVQGKPGVICLPQRVLSFDVANSVLGHRLRVPKTGVKNALANRELLEWVFTLKEWGLCYYLVRRSHPQFCGSQQQQPPVFIESSDELCTDVVSLQGECVISRKGTGFTVADDADI